MATTSSAEGMQAQAFEYVRQGQEAFTRMAGAVTDTWTSALRGGQAGPNSVIGANGGFPSPADVVDRSFDLGIQVLEAQRALVHGLLDAATPALRAAGATTRR